jgi:hypothetical protein
VERAPRFSALLGDGHRVRTLKRSPGIFNPEEIPAGNNSLLRWAEALPDTMQAHGFHGYSEGFNPGEIPTAYAGYPNTAAYPPEKSNTTLTVG